MSAQEVEAASIAARIVADSITDGGSRVITWELVYPRVIHAEVLTHGLLRRNSASSRAIPASKFRERVRSEPFIPVEWGKNQKGMQAVEEIADQAAARAWWLRAREQAMTLHEEGERLGLHKQIVNRVLDPFLMIVVILTGTDFANFFHQRCHRDAEPHIRHLARAMWTLFHEHMPVYRSPGEWHLPLADDDATREEVFALRGGIEFGSPNSEFAAKDLVRVSVGRCARVSYLNHNGVRDVREDIALHDRLVYRDDPTEPRHLSPTEHPCIAIGQRQRFGPFEGWLQYRKTFAHEAGPDTSDRCERCGCWGGRHVTECGGQSGSVA